MISQYELQRLLDYNPVTGDFTWKIRPKYTNIEVGSIAGFIDDKYLRQGIDGKYYRLHRLAFLWMTGEIPDEVDHINHKGWDNRWKNLRGVTHTENSKNQSRHKTNTTGHTGVYFTKPKYIARITVDGICRNLGTFEELRDAVHARERAEEYFGFHKNHGEENCS